MQQTRPSIVELGDEDRLVLLALASQCKVSRAQIMRWALRFYALRGPWAENIDDRISAIGKNRQLVVGPWRSGVSQ